MNLWQRLVEHIEKRRIVRAIRKQDRIERRLYGTTVVVGPTIPDEVQKRLKALYGSYAEPTDYVEFTGDALRFKTPEQDTNDKEN